MNLCKFHEMDKCAMQYCDFWNESRQTCSLALEIHARVELLERVNDLLKGMEKAGREEAVAKVAAFVAKNKRQMH